MKLPINIPELLKAAEGINEARALPVRVALFIDPTADEMLVHALRDAFVAGDAQAITSVWELSLDEWQNAVGYDLAVLVAGAYESTGEVSCRLRDAGVVTLTVTNLPVIAQELAAATASSLLPEDVIGPDPQVDGHNAADSRFNEEPYPMTVDRIRSVIETMGQWIVHTFTDKRLAFARSYPFVRRPFALDCVNTTSIQNAGIGAVVIIPGADMPLMTFNQAKMVLRIGAAWGYEMTLARWRELACVVGAGFACRSVARQVAPLVPGAGFALRAGIGAVGTQAIGRAAIAYFEGLSRSADTAEADTTEVNAAKVDTVKTYAIESGAVHVDAVEAGAVHPGAVVSNKQSAIQPVLRTFAAYAPVVADGAREVATQALAAGQRAGERAVPFVRNEVAPRAREVASYAAPMVKGVAGFAWDAAQPTLRRFAEAATPVVQSTAKRMSPALQEAFPRLSLVVRAGLAHERKGKADKE